MKVHIADNCKSLSWKPFEVEWENFVREKLKVPTVTPETFETYLSLDKDEKTIVKDCGGYIFGNLNKNSRAKENILSRNALLLDLDFAELNVWDDIKSKLWFETVLHSTHSHSSSTPRYRLIIPLNRDCSPDEYECLARFIAHTIGMRYFDKTTFQCNRLMYFPSHSVDGEWVFEWQNSKIFLDVDQWLSKFLNWKDLSSWFYHPDERNDYAGTGKKRSDPTKLGGTIGAFNAAYPMDLCIEEFLSNLYRYDGDDRYTYLKGSSSKGAVRYENLWLYSYHATDPAEGRLLSAFELCMCHLHENDLNKALNWAGNLPAVKELLKDKDFEDFESLPLSNKDAYPASDETSWITRLEIDKKRNIMPTDRNVNLIFKNDKVLKDTFRYNEFVNNVFLTKDTAWRKGIDPVKGDIIRNTDYPCLRTYIGLKYGLTNRAMIEEHLISIAYAKKYHPIREYLANLTWDGVSRLETTLQDYFGAEDNEYTREVFKRQMIGACLRVFNPGCKHDNIMVLVGPEGTAKSEFIKRLGGIWFSDTFDLSKDKTVYEQLQNVWIVEIGEIDKLSRIEIGEVKSFVVKQSDKYRPAFGKTVEDYPRQCIFMGTTNEETFLRSETGNRRFYPVTVQNGMWERGLHASKKYVWVDMTEYEVQQIWAEAFNLMLLGERNSLSKEATLFIDRNIINYEEQNPYTGEIENMLQTLVPENYESMTMDDIKNFWGIPELRKEGVKYIEKVCVLQIWCEMLGRSRESFDKLKGLEIQSAIRKSKMIDTSSNNREYTKRYGQQRVYKVLRK